MTTTIGIPFYEWKSWEMKSIKMYEQCVFPLIFAFLYEENPALALAATALYASSYVLSACLRNRGYEFTIENGSVSGPEEFHRMAFLQKHFPNYMQSLREVLPWLQHEAASHGNKL